jgi:pimeloyl-ACP methyl ester carboxylesterase
MKVKLNGIEIEYQDGGQGSPVLLGHGYSATGRMWDGQRAALGDRYRVISWDMRGHGRTDSPTDPAQYSAALTVADMRGLLQHCGVERAVVGGLSLGGYVALAFYLAHPEMVRALVICDSGPGYRNAEARAAWNRRWPAAAGRCARRWATTARRRASPTPPAACSPRRARP